MIMRISAWLGHLEQVIFGNPKDWKRRSMALEFWGLLLQDLVDETEGTQLMSESSFWS